ncbi:MAG: YeeE/YedE family protein, partial [Clostridiales Family XIII bacterium]|nr:YeeE/YedE family protein [Clostridiales Family XIII bacterium]
WNFLGLYAVGFAATLASGCPLRQMVLAGQGHIEAVVTFLGLLFGAALVHRLGLAASGNSIADGVVKIGVVPPAGKAALIISIVFLFILAVSCRNNAAEPAKRDDTVSEA